jgi:hypothetical protein
MKNLAANWGLVLVLPIFITLVLLATLRKQAVKELFVTGDRRFFNKKR